MSGVQAGTETGTTTARSVEFDESGQAVATDEVTTEIEDEGEGEGASAAVGEPAKYKIGNKEFATQAEAYAYAQSLEQQGNQDDAYRQIVESVLQQPPQTGQSVTPSQAKPKLEIDEAKLWENPSQFLSEFAEKVQAQTIQTMGSQLAQQQAARDTGEQVWREFSSRHPDLADFRTEVEGFTGQNMSKVKAIIKRDGQAAGYDYIAMCMRDQFKRYADVGKPRRELQNGGTNMTPSSGSAPNVTPKGQQKKPLTFAEQIRSIKKRR